MVRSLSSSSAAASSSLCICINLFSSFSFRSFQRRIAKRSPNTSFKGVFYLKKDYNLAKHPDIDVPNLQVIKLMQSFKSNEYLRETFAWMHYYWYLTNDGIEFLRTYLNFPIEIVPNTLNRAANLF
ncbi:hypothetical protein ACSBR1_004004 [Camellia fascicularis]